MNKEELEKKYQDIVLNTNGGNDDYVVALCQIAGLIMDAGKEIELLQAENKKLREGDSTMCTEYYINQLKEKDGEIAELNRSISKINIDYNKKNLILEKALELACKEVPSNHCPDPPERINMQDEYGSDEPYYLYEGGCPYEDGSHCLECCMAHFKQKAREFIDESIPF